jgi:hypothetical protein
MQVRMRYRAVRETLARLVVARDGVEAIEFAFVLPVLALFLLGIVEFGRLMWTQTSLQYAVEAASRCTTVGAACTSGAIVGPGSSNYAAQHVYGITVPEGAIFGYTSPPPACGNQVVACYPFQFMVPYLFPFHNSPPAACPGGYAPPSTGLTLIATGCHQA